eukprot:6190649-Pleurochrysis_carterae.AAC.3
MHEQALNRRKGVASVSRRAARLDCEWTREDGLGAVGVVDGAEHAPLAALGRGPNVDLGHRACGERLSRVLERLQRGVAAGEQGGGHVGVRKLEGLVVVLPLRRAQRHGCRERHDGGAADAACEGGAEREGVRGACSKHARLDHEVGALVARGRDERRREVDRGVYAPLEWDEAAVAVGAGVGARKRGSPCQSEPRRWVLLGLGEREDLNGGQRASLDGYRHRRVGDLSALAHRNVEGVEPAGGERARWQQPIARGRGADAAVVLGVRGVGARDGRTCPTEVELCVRLVRLEQPRGLSTDRRLLAHAAGHGDGVGGGADERGASHTQRRLRARDGVELDCRRGVARRLVDGGSVGPRKVDEDLAAGEARGKRRRRAQGDGAARAEDGDRLGGDGDGRDGRLRARHAQLEGRRARAQKVLDNDKKDKRGSAVELGRERDCVDTDAVTER